MSLREPVYVNHLSCLGIFPWPNFMSHRTLCHRQRFAESSKVSEWQNSCVGLLRSVKVGYVIFIVEIKNKKVVRVVKLHILVCFAQNWFILVKNLRNWTKWASNGKFIPYRQYWCTLFYNDKNFRKKFGNFLRNILGWIQGFYN